MNPKSCLATLPRQPVRSYGIIIVADLSFVLYCGRVVVLDLLNTFF
ncbi:MAG: hypothetical protein Q8916_00830 [Bacteroidota bacterium]|nr:hypothetical protein [Bacteroidota bacterium]